MAPGGPTWRCPACQRSFEEAGFCPYDRTRLISTAQAELPTIVSTAMQAQQPPADGRTELEQRRGTFPLTPSSPPVPMVSTQEITSARQRPAPSEPPPHSQSERMRAVSASENPAEALDVVSRGSRANEYDRLVGQTLDGRYYVEKKIGEGGMGVVFAAKHAVIERPLAIKVLKREVMRDTATIRRFVQEAKAASRIGHPNIVDVTDFGTTPDGMTYSVMEYVPGQTLGQAIRHGAPFSLQRAVRIAAQIARALGAAHDKGIVHRDLKPENVFLLDRDGRTDFVKIVDFGIAKVTPTAGQANEPRLTRAGSVFGTPEYMAPEQAAGRSDTDGRVDIYALGVILYEMIVGKVPHRGDSMVRTLAMQMLDPVEPPSKVRPDLGISPDLEAVILHALAKKREQRYQTMGELLAGLEAVLPAPVGQSVTGSPVYTLAALPPGADAAMVAAQLPSTLTPASEVSVNVARPAPSTAGERAHSPSQSPITRRPKDEPQFVTATDKPVSFEHVFTEEYAQPGGRRRRWPLALLGALIVGGAAGAVAVMLKSHKAATGAIDGGLVVVPAPVPPIPPADAQVVAEISEDAARELLRDGPPPRDAAEEIVLIEPDAAPRPHPRIVDGGGGPGPVTMPETPNHRGTIAIQVLTRPEGALLYNGTTYRGPGGTTIEEAPGTRMEITCRQTGYKPGKVQLVFDGKTEGALCLLSRIKICINGIKNPFDDCEVDPNQNVGP